MSFHSHTSHRWSERWYLIFMFLPVALWATMIFVSAQIFWVGLAAMIVFYWYARKRFAQSGRRIRSKENAILTSGMLMITSAALTRLDFINNGLMISSHSFLFVIEIALMFAGYLVVLLAMFLPTGIEEAAENAVDDGIRPNMFITGN